MPDGYSEDKPAEYRRKARELRARGVGLNNHNATACAILADEYELMAREVEKALEAIET